MHPSAAGFTKEAGLRELAGRAIKGVGRALGSTKLEGKGFRMQHGGGSLTRRPGASSRVPALPVPATTKPKMQLMIPHGTGKEQAAVMRGTSKAKQPYVTPHGFGKSAGLKRVRRVTRAALISRKAAPAAEKATSKHRRRVARWGLKNVGKVGPDVVRAYQAHADASSVAARF
jgi:hypothetical protein